MGQTKSPRMDNADVPKTDDALEEVLEETFPASDPPANTVETGIRIKPADVERSRLVVRDNRDASRFELALDGQLAYLTYRRGPTSFVLVHTEVPDALRGRGVASELARTGLQMARTEGLPLVVECPFVRAYLKKHPI